MILKRIAAATGVVALAVIGPLFATGTAQASSPTTPYMCPWFINDGSRSVHSWVQGQGQIICHYDFTATMTCRYNAYNGDPWYHSQPSSGPNPSYCPPRAIPTTA